MLLASEESERFYRIWWPLLRFVNEQRQIVPKLLKQQIEAGSLSPQQAYKIRSALWKDDSLREAFMSENPAGLDQQDLSLVASWRQRRSGQFFVFRHLKSYTVFIDSSSPPKAYGVLGLLSPFEEVVGSYLPVLVEAVLLPFENKIIYDGLIAPYSVSFGSGYRADLNLAYRDAKEREGIITSLVPASDSENNENSSRQIHVRNTRILAAFRKDLYAAGLIPKTVEHHVANITAFAANYLLIQSPPRPLLDIAAPDIDLYLGREQLSQKEVDSIVTSMKRFVRFLLNTQRIDPDVAFAIQDNLKDYKRSKL